jgi:flagellar biosynthetic protein FliP
MKYWIQVLVAVASLVLANGVVAQGGATQAPNATATQPYAMPSAASNQGTQATQSDQPSLNITLPGLKRQSLGSAIEIVLFMTLMSMAPAIIMTMTCFTRVIIVLSFLRRAMSMQDLPPTIVVTGFAVFMSLFIMKPVIIDLKSQCYTPYVEGTIDFTEAAELASARMKKFMARQTRDADIQLLQRLGGGKEIERKEDTPFHVMVPAFILSEIKTAFQMGFVLFLPFVIIDLVISSILVSMGMFTLPPVVISTPLKLLLFVMIDGWALVVESLAESFVVST